MKRHFFYATAVLSFVFAFLASARASDELSLQQALQYLDSAPQVKAQQADTEAAKARVWQATGAFLPAVSLSQGMSRTNDPVGVFATKLQQGRFSAGDFDVTRLNNPDAVNGFTTSVNVQQPILNSAVDLYNLSSAKKAATATQHAEHFVVGQIKLQVIHMYYSAVALKLKSNILSQGISKMKALEGSFEQAQAPTTANETNYLVAKSIRAGLEAQNTQVRMAEQTTLKQLLAMLGRPSTTVPILTDTLPLTTRNTENISTPQTRPDVLAATLFAKAMQKKHQATVWSWAPRLDAFANYQIFSENLSNSNDAYAVGALLSWPLFQGPRPGQVKESLAQMHRAQELEQVTSFEAEAARQNSTLQVQAAQQQHALMTQASQNATAALALARQRYLEGTLPLLDYSQTIQNWTAMQTSLIDTRLGVVLSKQEKIFNEGNL